MVKQKKLLLQCIDNSVIIMSFVLDDGKTVFRDGTPEEIDAEIQKISKSFPQERMPIVSWKEIIDDDIPQDRTFRDAWVTDGSKKIEVNMNRAKNIHRDHLRSARLQKLIELDYQYMKADEESDVEKKKEIAAQKKILRDITDDPRIESATTPDELKLVWINK